MKGKFLCSLVIHFTCVSFFPSGTLALTMEKVLSMPTDNNIDIDNVLAIPNPNPISSPLNPEEESPYIEGDILEDKVPSKSGYTNSEKHWRDGQVVYKICSSFTGEEGDKIKLAMKEIEENTCITFHEGDDDDSDYVDICNLKTGCSSYVGFQGGAQTLNLAPSCLRSTTNNPNGIGTACHEIIHALGFRHEHCRQDRDEHITINWENVKPGAEVNFKILAGTGSYQVPYDYESVMHYSATAFAVDSAQPTIVANEGEVKMGQRSGPTEMDYQKVNQMYGCYQVRNRNRKRNTRR